MEKLLKSLQEKDVESQVDLSRCFESDGSDMHVLLKQLFQMPPKKDV